jgi:signal transduction histidine kinase
LVIAGSLGHLPRAALAQVFLDNTRWDGDDQPMAATHPRDRVVGVAAVAVLVYGGLCVAVLADSGLGHRAVTVFDDLSELGAAALACTFCVLAARHLRGRRRRAWTFIGVSAGLWAAGQGAWTYQELVLDVAPNDLFPSWPDLGFLAAIPFATAGLLHLGRDRRSHRANVRLLLDSAMVAGGLLFFSWWLVLAPIQSLLETDLRDTLVSFAYPLGDVAMATIVVVLIARLDGAARRAAGLLVVGIALNALADSFFAWYTTAGTEGGSNPSNAGWTIGYLFIALAGLRKLRAGAAPPTSPRASARTWNVLVYAPVGAMLISGTAIELTGQAIDTVMMLDLLVVIAAVFVRQFLLLTEVARLNRQIADQNAHLEKTVDERTAELQLTVGELAAADSVRRRLLRRLVTVQEEERQEISDTIHDEMLQSVVAAKMQMYMVARDTTGKAVQQVDAQLDEAIRRMRGLMTDLRPQLADMGLAAALQPCVDDARAMAGCTVQITDRLGTEPDPLNGMTIFRVVRESLVNIRKHAPGSTVRITLTAEEDTYVTSVSDDGPGFDAVNGAVSPAGHRGLTMMSERTEAMGGTLRLRSAPGAGTSIELMLPRLRDSRTETPTALSEQPLADPTETAMPQLQETAA